jgi:hypothetical protein
MCLQYVRQAFNLPIRYGSATEAWQKSASQHQDRNFPSGAWVPVWFSIDIEPLGHVALLAPDGTVYSSSDMTSTPHHHPSIDDLISYYARWGKMQLTYLGWTEDVAGYPVIASSTITAQGTVTSQEDTMTPEQWTFVQTVLTSLSDHAATKDDVYGLKVWTQGVGNTTGDRIINDHRAQIANVPANVLNQSFKLADGTVTNLAGILSAINAKPVTGAAIVSDPSAVVKALAAQLNK